MRREIVIGLFLCLLVSSVWAEGNDHDVYVYTNADLERLDPIPSQGGTPPTPEEIEAGWAFVDSMIDAAHARIDARRDYELARTRTEAETDAIERVANRPRYGLPYNYFLRDRVGYEDGVYGERELGGLVRADVSRLWNPPNAELFRPITPIYARPYLTNLFRLPGAFPGRAAPGGGVGAGPGGRGPGPRAHHPGR